MRTYAAYLRKSRADADKTIEEVLASHRHDLLKLAKSMNVAPFSTRCACLASYLAPPHPLSPRFHPGCPNRSRRCRQ